MYWNGARMDGNYPLSIVTDGISMNITLVTYDQNVDFGIIACRRSVPQVQRMIDYMEDALVELEDAAGISARADKKVASGRASRPAAKSRARPKAKAKAKVKPTTKAKPKAKKKAAPKKKVQPKAKAKAKAKPKTKTRARPERTTRR